MDDKIAVWLEEMMRIETDDATGVTRVCSGMMKGRHGGDWFSFLTFDVPVTICPVENTDEENFRLLQTRVIRALDALIENIGNVKKNIEGVRR